MCGSYTRNAKHDRRSLHTGQSSEISGHSYLTYQRQLRPSLALMTSAARKNETVQNGGWGMKKYVLPVIMLIVFETVAITLWLTKDNLFYLFNFSIIFAAITDQAYMTKQEKCN